MKGTWQGSGTWQTAGGGPGAGLVAALAVAVAVIGALEWLVARIWWLIGGTVLLAALAAAVFAALLRWAGRREARHAPAWTVRAEVITAARPQAAPGRPPAIENHWHIHVGDLADLEAARRVIGQPSSGGTIN